MTDAATQIAPAFTLRMTQIELERFLDRAFPAGERPRLGAVDSIEPGMARLRLVPSEDMLRPGAILSGPAQMALIDVAAYAVVLAHVGPEPMAVTHGLNVSFLRAASRDPVMAEASLLRLGRRLATVDVRLYQGEEARFIAQATVGYALPDKGGAA